MKAEQLSELPQPSSHTTVQRIRVLGVDITYLPALVQFLILVGGVFAFFLLCGSLEEYIFRNLPGFGFGWYMTVFELLGFALLAAIEIRLSGKNNVWHHEAPLRNHAIVAISMSLSRGLTNVSLQYLNYPTQVIFKSLKLIAVLLCSVFLYKKRYQFQEYIAAVLLVASAMLFTLGDVEVSPKFSWIGIFIVVLSLVFDALHSNTQENVLQSHNAPMLELMFYGNLYGSFGAIFICAVSGEMASAVAFCWEHPIVYLFFAIRLIVVYSGVLCFVAIIKRFGVVMATTVTTVRKVLSVIVSFISFPKPFHSVYIIAGAIFVCGTALNIRAKRNGLHIQSKKS